MYLSLFPSSGTTSLTYLNLPLNVVRVHSSQQHAFLEHWSSEVCLWGFMSTQCSFNCTLCFLHIATEHTVADLLIHLCSLWRFCLCPFLLLVRMVKKKKFLYVSLNNQARFCRAYTQEREGLDQKRCASLIGLGTAFSNGYLKTLSISIDTNNCVPTALPLLGIKSF